MTAAEKVDVVCDTREAECRCVLPPNHDGPHECDPAICGGSWTFGEDGQFRIVRIPRPGGYGGQKSLPGPARSANYPKAGE